MKVYLDYASTTPTDPKVLAAMLPFFSEKFGNAESLHSMGHEAKIAIDQARKTISEILNCSPSEITFTNSGTAGNNLALIGTARANQDKGKHIITSKTEHASILKTCQYLETEGFKVSYINPEDLEETIRPDTILVSIMYANNEVGTINDISKIGVICKERDILFHSDACQAGAYLPLDVQDLHPDMITLNGSKIYGPKGVGGLYIKKYTPISPIIHGGGQEHGLHSGTHNTPAIVGLATALQLAQANRQQESQRLTPLRDELIKTLLQEIPGSKINGDPKNRLPNNINIHIPHIDGKEMLLQLDAHGILCSTGAACSVSKEEASHVLLALGLSEEEANSSIRLTLGNATTAEQLKYTSKILLEILQKTA